MINPLANPVNAIDCLALVDARDTLAEVKNGIAALHFTLAALQAHIDNLGAQLNPASSGPANGGRT